MAIITITASGTYTPVAGNTYIISPLVDGNVTFTAGTGYEVQINDDNVNKISLKFADDSDVTVTVGAGVQAPEMHIDGGKNSQFDVILNDDSTFGDIDVGQAGTSLDLTAGDRVTVLDITGGDADTNILFGTNATIGDIATGDGINTVNLGASATVGNIDGGSGADTIVIGPNSLVGNTMTGDGDDSVTYGSGTTADDTHLDGGNDTLIIGDNVTLLNHVRAGSGNDTVTIGSSFLGSGDIDGGSDIDRITYDGYLTSDPLLRDDEMPDGTQINNFEMVACFVTGTEIETEAGPQLAETLRVGDMVRTLDHGYQPIRKIISRHIEFTDETAGLKPIEFKPGSLGPNCPARPLRVSPQHRVLLSTPDPKKRVTADDENLVAAKGLVHHPGVRQMKGCREVSYYHLIFDRHEIVFSEGVATESFYPGPMALGTVGSEQRRELLKLFPELATLETGGSVEPARRFLRPGVARRTYPRGLQLAGTGADSVRAAPETVIA